MPAVEAARIGAKPERIPQLFEPFPQGQAGLSRKYGGTCLGLSICRALVELHGRRIDMQSAPGAGTTVTVRLPASGILRGA